MISKKRSWKFYPEFYLHFWVPNAHAPAEALNLNVDSKKAEYVIQQSLLNHVYRFALKN